VPATIIVPLGNSLEKNASMRALGVRLIEHGEDFMESIAYSKQLAEEEQLHLVPSFAPMLVQGVASYALELFKAVPDLDTAYVPIGLGSGICGMMAARDALGLKTKIVGVVSEHANAYAQSFKSKQMISTESANTLADGVACRIPNAEALELIQKGTERIITVTDEAVLRAMKILYTDTHNIAEGAGAIALAGLISESSQMRGKKVAVILSGGNVDFSVYQRALATEI